MPLNVLVVNANWDIPTGYLASWTQAILKRIQKHEDVNVVELSGSFATRKNVERKIESENPDLIVLNGHGGSDHICGYQNCILIKVDENTNMLAGKQVHALACQTGKKLGQHVVEIGGKAFIGYSEDFRFCHQKKEKSSDQISDEFASPTLDPAFEAIEAMLTGSRPGEAFVKSQSRYKEKLLALITNPDPTYSTLIAACTLHNLKHQVLFENGKPRQASLFLEPVE